MKLNKTLANLC